MKTKKPKQINGHSNFGIINGTLAANVVMAINKPEMKINKMKKNLRRRSPVTD